MRVRLKFIKHQLIKKYIYVAHMQLQRLTAFFGVDRWGGTVGVDVRWSFSCNMRITREGRGRRARAVQHVPAHVPSATHGLSMASSKSCVHICVCQKPVSLCQYSLYVALFFSSVFVIGYAFLLTSDDVQIHHHICPFMYSLIYSTILWLIFPFHPWCIYMH